MDGHAAGAIRTAPSMPRRLLQWDRAHRLDGQTAALMLAMDVPWLLYTRLYFWLHPRGATFAPSLFMHLAGRPDPTCGLTRTFAWMWRGDILRAVAVYPLGPAVFVAAFVVLGYACLVLMGGWALRVELPPRLRRTLTALTIGLLLANWAAKLIWLGV